MHLTDIEAGVLALAAAADAGSWTTFSVLSAAASARRLAERGYGEMRDDDDPRSVAFRATRRGREALAGGAIGLDGVDARILALAAEEPEDGWTRLREDAADTLAALNRLADLGLGEFRQGDGEGAAAFRANDRGRAEAAARKASQGQALSFGIGTACCGDIPVGDQDKALQWAFGYWSGLNEGTDRAVGDATDPRTIADDIFDRCGRNPQAKMYDVVRRLYAEYLQAGR